MEEVSLHNKEEEESASDVNVYITIDPASLQKFKKSSSSKKRHDHPSVIPSVLKDCLDELGLNPKWSICVSKRGVLLMVEIVLSLTLLLIAALSQNWRFGYTASALGIVMNSISLAGSIALLIWLSLDFHFLCQEALNRFIEIAVYLVFLILQITSFITSVADSEVSGEAVVFEIFSLVMCCLLLLNIYFTNDEYIKNRNTILPQTSSKKERGRRRMQKKKKYKRLGQSGF